MIYNGFAGSKLFPEGSGEDIFLVTVAQTVCTGSKSGSAFV